MIKKISVSYLKPGMYIHDLNCSWVHHPFFLRRFKVENGEQINDIHQAGITDVYIDTIKGKDVEAPSTETEASREKLNNELNRILKTGNPHKFQASVSEEIERAKEARTDAQRAIQDILVDVRLGRQVDVEKADHCVEKLVDSVLRNKDALLSLDLIRNRDRYTFEHSVSVSVLLIAFGNELGLSREEVQKIGLGGLLHDIGKTKIPDEILHKPGKLSDEEYTLMKKHVEYGAEILSDSADLPDDIMQIVLQHHERLDGTGYPRQIKGDEISLFGQMAAIVDVYDAIASDRCYHRGEPPTSVLRKMLEWSRSHFNEELVHKFIHTVGIYPVGTLVRLENGHIAVVVEQSKRGLLYPMVRVIYDPKNGGYILPYLLDLSVPKPGKATKIVAYENPEKWRIPVQRFIHYH